MKTFMTVIKPAMRMIAFSEADAGERCLYLLTSVRFGNRDVLTIIKTGSGALFSINYKFGSVKREAIMTEEQRKDAGTKFWNRMQEVLGPYL